MSLLGVRIRPFFSLHKLLYKMSLNSESHSVSLNKLAQLSAVQHHQPENPIPALILNWKLLLWMNRMVCETKDYLVPLSHIYLKNIYIERDVLQLTFVCVLCNYNLHQSTNSITFPSCTSEEFLVIHSGCRSTCVEHVLSVPWLSEFLAVTF